MRPLFRAFYSLSTCIEVGVNNVVSLWHVILWKLGVFTLALGILLRHVEQDFHE